MKPHRVTFRIHSIQRMFERQVSAREVLNILLHGETIEEFPDDVPYPNQLLLGWRGTRPIHVVVVENNAENETILITVYQPDPLIWKPGFRQRKP